MAFEAVYWMVIAAGIFSFIVAYGIGANDVANAFATSVGSRTLKMYHAIIIASIFEFGGAVGLGAGVAKTIAGGIADPETFQSDPDSFAFGQLCALMSAAFWLLLATYLELPVSTTHTIVGGVVGFAFVYGGPSAIKWATPKDEFPYYDGMVPIVVSWFLSPIMAGLIASCLFLIIRAFVLRAENGAQRAVWLLPVFIFITVFVNAFFIFLKGAKNVLHWEAGTAAWVAVVIAAGCAIIGGIIGTPMLKKKIASMIYEREHPEEFKDAEKLEEDVDEAPPTNFFGKIFYNIKSLVTIDVHKEAEKTGVYVHEMQAHAEQFDPVVEYVFTWLQVLTACAVSFAHGANDTANAIGPFAAIYYVWQTYRTSSKADATYWMMAMGGGGLVVGLATYGWKIIMVLGVKTVAITPSRGFCIELTTAMTVSIGSFSGLPLSSTHCQVGGTVGVGMCEGRGGVRVPLIIGFFCGWVMTLIIAASVSAGFFAFGSYAPSLPQKAIVQELTSTLFLVTQGQLVELNAAVSPTVNPDLYNLLNALTPLTNTSVDQLTGAISSNAGVLTQIVAYQSPTRNGTISSSYGPIYVYDPTTLNALFQNASGIYTYNSDPSVQGNGVPPVLGYGMWNPATNTTITS